MPAKKKSTKANSSKKEVLPEPVTIKNGTGTVFIGGWSSYDTIESVSQASRSVIAANTDADGVVAAPLPRTDVLVLPTEKADDDADSGAAQAPFVVEVADQFFVEGVSRHQCAQAQALVKTWEPAPAQPTEATAPSEQIAAPAPEEEAVNPYADAVSDRRYTQEVLVGASYAARDVVIRGPCSIEGVAPIIVVPPQLPEKPDLDAVTLDPPADNAAAAAGVSTKKKKTAKSKKKSKPKLTPEQVEELERKKAELEAQYMRQTEEAVQRAKQESDYLMTFAHPDRWANVVFRHMTFAGPVQVHRAHVSFQNCRFVGITNTAMLDRPLLLVSQYCRVQCTKCSFEAPQRCGIYALPSAQVGVRKCLFTGVKQDILWAAALPGVSPQNAGAAASLEVDGGDDDSAGHGRTVSPTDAADDHSADHKAAGVLSFPVALGGELQEAARAALDDRSAAVGILSDCAKLMVHGCDFLCLGVGVYVKGSYTVYVSHHKAAPKTPQQLTPEACDTSLDSNSFHHFANAALLLDRSSRLVSIRRSYVEGSAHYGLDCQGGASSVLVRQNYFAADATVRIREGAKVAMLHNDFQSIPLNDNSYGNPCLQSVY
ncbi:conserved hypothetical protein [Leishmania infantum JPCM5]|uniref:Uncharacterized protein n=2 Tax=Leishmania infantum TaxID=5671 RepID=A4IA80_LEIIN|nr:conserved hypothetical protein [Leishmania infantum JPCM5]CAC9540066.1 hypothetical_protein_-_conserved [Leishmania infantum]CAM71736.1 conserved hypothetical protein [Leishmania infantum JPCM5]SUZ45678.1 hypothetical_protein_-_conserved [Leishmania infantum]|eukprot:XP_001468649.1 conserved hypothetical protein [Leishmania infantum JPCM5]